MPSSSTLISTTRLLPQMVIQYAHRNPTFESSSRGSWVYRAAEEKTGIQWTTEHFYRTRQVILQPPKWPQNSFLDFSFLWTTNYSRMSAYYFGISNLDGGVELLISSFCHPVPTKPKIKPVQNTYHLESRSGEGIKSTEPSGCSRSGVICRFPWRPVFPGLGHLSAQLTYLLW